MKDLLRITNFLIKSGTLFSDWYYNSLWEKVIKLNNQYYKHTIVL